MKPPSWNDIRTEAAKFAQRWANETDENAGAQTFWNEFLAIFGVDRKRVAVFEKRAERLSTGGRGRIDLFWPGVLIAEHKSAGKDLTLAENQALDYLESIQQDQFPGLLVVSDFARIRITDLGGDNQAFEFPLTDLPKEIDRFAYLAGYSGRQLKKSQEHQVDIAAARLMGSLYDQITKTGFTDHEVSIFLVRMLFLMFADDTGLWEKALFQEFIETRTSEDGSDLGAQLAALFQTLDKPENNRAQALDELLARFPYVNGGLFSDKLDIPYFDRHVRDILIQCGNIDWGSIVPAIFGSLFQAVKSKEDRRLLGEHYTTEQNIHRVIGPLFLNDLQHEYETAYHDSTKLNKLRSKLGTLTFLDPACGCGNFLVIAYRALRQLELDIMIRLTELTGQSQLQLDATLGLKVSPAQFHGIEVEEWPARIAETAMFLIDHQANQILARTFGEAPDRLPISTSADIRVGNAITMDWNDVLPADDNVIVLGNPPFIGMAYLTAEQQADNRHAFEQTPHTKGLRTGRLDYVACWYAKTMTYLNGTRGKAAFVSTNSITQGEQARTMLPLVKANGYQITFAHRSFKWSSEAPGAAAVHVVIIGFSQTASKTRQLYDYPDINGEPELHEVQHINWYLLDAPDIAPEKRNHPLLPDLPNASKGSQPTDGGHLIVEPDQYGEIANDPIAAKYLKPFRQATEMLYNNPRWCLWLKDATPSDLKNSTIIRQRLEEVRRTRSESKTASVREQAATPTLFTQDRQPDVRYLALPEVSSENREYIPGQYYEPDTIAGNKLILWPDAPLWLFGILQSAAFNSWIRAYAGRLESRISISPSLTYFTYPFLKLTAEQQTRIEQAAQEVLDARNNHPENSLAELYDTLAMPADLRKAHNHLDKAVDHIYGLTNPSENERIQSLTRHYEQITNEGQLAFETSKKKTRKK